MTVESGPLPNRLVINGPSIDTPRRRGVKFILISAFIFVIAIVVHSTREADLGATHGIDPDGPGKSINAHEEELHQLRARTLGITAKGNSPMTDDILGASIAET